MHLREIFRETDFVFNFLFDNFKKKKSISAISNMRFKISATTEKFGIDYLLFLLIILT